MNNKQNRMLDQSQASTKNVGTIGHTLPGQAQHVLVIGAGPGHVSRAIIKALAEKMPGTVVATK